MSDKRQELINQRNQIFWDMHATNILTFTMRDTVDKYGFYNPEISPRQKELENRCRKIQEEINELEMKDVCERMQDNAIAHQEALTEWSNNLFEYKDE